MFRIPRKFVGARFEGTDLRAMHWYIGICMLSLRKGLDLEVRTHKLLVTLLDVSFVI